MNVQHNLLQGYLKARLKTLTMLSPAAAGRELFRLFCTPVSRYRLLVSGPFKTAKPLSFELGENTIRGFIANESGERKCLILHGWTSSLSKFEHLVQPLIDQNYAVLAFDAPAHGNSDGRITNALDYAGMIEKVNVLYGPVNAYIAHSFGGLAVCLALNENPKLQKKARLVLIAPAAETSTALDNVFHFLNLHNPILRQAVEAEIKDVSGKDVSWFSIDRAMANIKMPVLWLQDSEDFITPEKDMLPLMNKNYPNIRFVMSKGLGHQRIYREPQSVNSVIDFLK